MTERLLQHKNEWNSSKPVTSSLSSATILVSVGCKKNIYKIVLNYPIYMTIYKSKNLQSVNIKTLKSSNRSNKLMFAEHCSEKDFVNVFLHLLYVCMLCPVIWRYYFKDHKFFWLHDITDIAHTCSNAHMHTCICMHGRTHALRTHPAHSHTVCKALHTLTFLKSF